MRTFATLFKNEMKLNIRNMNMVIFAVILPLVVMAVLRFVSAKDLGNGAFRPTEESFGALCAISMCAGGLMGLPLVLSEYRERKILKRFRVAPVGPALLIAVELAVFLAYCVVSAITLFLSARLILKDRPCASPLSFAGAWVLTAACSLSVGTVVGGIAGNTKHASVIASVLYFPTIIFSGTTIPTDVLPKAMQNVVNLLPITQGIRMMNSAFLGMPIENPWLPVVVTAAVTTVCTGIAIRFFRWE